VHEFTAEDVIEPHKSSPLMALNPKSFLYTVDPASAVAIITLNRPERLNALTFEVYTELRDTFRALDTEPGIRAVIITGTGRAFCTGGDVEDIIGSLFSRDAARLLEFTRLTGDLILSIRQCRRPVVAALNGTVAGAGAVIAAASDIRIAAESAKIAFLFSRVGLTGADMGAAWLLPRIVGLAHASELLMLGDFITAERAAQIGLYNRVVPGERLMAEATDVAARLARGPSVALGVTKQALNQEAAMALVSAIEWEAQAQAECMQNPNFREAYEAFRDKRDPKFE
jgi:enoyl-CoA hydratase/carnithine racemase